MSVTVVNEAADLERIRKSEAIKRLVDRLYPHIDHSTFVSPLCDVWLADGAGVATVRPGGTDA